MLRAYLLNKQVFPTRGQTEMRKEMLSYMKECNGRAKNEQLYVYATQIMGWNRDMSKRAKECIAQSYVTIMATKKLQERHHCQFG